MGEPEVVVLGISKNMIDQVLTTLHTWKGGGMGSIKELRSTTGRLSWVGGILPRLRWTVNVLYATFKDVEREQQDGTEERRAAGREDTRSKVGLFPIKRLGGVHLWLLKLFENPVENLIRIERMKKPKVSWGIITDASPKGWGPFWSKCWTRTQSNWYQLKQWKASSRRTRQSSSRWTMVSHRPKR